MWNKGSVKLQGAWLLKQNENTKYVKLGITGAAVLAFGFAIMYILNQSQSIAAGIRVIFNILKPFLYGALIAYILAPMCNRMDDRFLKWCPNATEKQKKGMKFLSIAIAIICAVTLVVLLILLILPQVWDSTIKIIVSFRHGLHTAIKNPRNIFLNTLRTSINCTVRFPIIPWIVCIILEFALRMSFRPLSICEEKWLKYQKYVIKIKKNFTMT